MQHIKRLALIFASLLICLAFASACGADGQSGDLDNGAGARLPTDNQSEGSDASDDAGGEANADTGGGDSTVSDAQPEPLSMEKDMGLSVNNRWFPIMQDVTGLLQALGDDFVMTSAPS